MTVDEWARPEPAADWVAIRPEAAGICGSEVEGYVGRQPNRRPPLVMGHEFAGVVIETGGGADPGWLGRRGRLKPGASRRAWPLFGTSPRRLRRPRGLMAVPYSGCV